jgi:hypothetical protein
MAFRAAHGRQIIDIPIENAEESNDGSLVRVIAERLHVKH